VAAPPRRLALIGDTHMPKGARRLPERCLELLASADLIVHTGDFSERAILEQLQGLGRVVAVHGNVDSDELRRELPERITVDLGGVALGLVHDSGPSRDRIGRLRREFPEADAVVFGHSHMPLHERDGTFQIFNPGSPTERRRAPAHTMGLATVGDGEIDFEHVDL
jgi:putative phosphoesterase